eukprot:IDg10863t1
MTAGFITGAACDDSVRVVSLALRVSCDGSLAECCASIMPRVTAGLLNWPRRRRGARGSRACGGGCYRVLLDTLELHEASSAAQRAAKFPIRCTSKAKKPIAPLPFGGLSDDIPGHRQPLATSTTDRLWTNFSRCNVPKLRALQCTLKLPCSKRKMNMITSVLKMEMKTHTNDPSVTFGYTITGFADWLKAMFDLTHYKEALDVGSDT